MGLYCGPRRLATPRGRQFCSECYPQEPCSKHPFVEGLDRWEHDVDALSFGWRTINIPAGYGMSCPAERDGYACTLDAGHDGVHAAHGSDLNHPSFLWPNEAHVRRVIEISERATGEDARLISVRDIGGTLDPRCAECRGECDDCADPVDLACDEVVRAVNNLLSILNVQARIVISREG